MCPSDVLVVAEVIDALCLAQIAQQQLALVFWLIGGRGRDLLGQFCCVIGECFARWPTTELDLVLLPGGRIVIGIWAWNTSRGPRHVLEEAGVLVFRDRVVRLALWDSNFGAVIAMDSHSRCA